MEGRQSKRGTTRRLRKRSKYLLDLAPSSSSHSDVDSSPTVQMASAFAVTGKDWIGSFFSIFQFFVAHLFPLFSLTVHSNNILIKVISIYNFYCILMNVFLLVLWGCCFVVLLWVFLVWYFSFIVKISNYQGNYNEIH